MHPEFQKAVKIRFALPSARLQPFLTTYYHTDVSLPENEVFLEDFFHPEWSNLRFMKADWCDCAIGDAALQPAPAFSVTGPTSKALRFQIRSGRSWGIGLLPLGWACLFDAPAGDYADQVVDGAKDQTFDQFSALSDRLSKSGGGFAEELAIIESHMEQVILRENSIAAKIEAVNQALLDGDMASVTQLADRVNMNVRSLERLSKRVFGFSPKLLLRRQRFLRSLAQFMLDPSLKWLNTLDFQYHDQAHFVRDFKQFMGMSPSAYAKLDKPILMAAAQARMAAAGEALQVLHDPSATVKEVES